MQRTLILHPYLKRQQSASVAEAKLAEATALAEAISLKTVLSQAIPLNQWRPATLIGQGSAQSFEKFIKNDSIQLVVINAHVSPIQQRNLERLWQCKVIDRTGLILEIFGARARTEEGKLQVELAALSYQRSRLVRSWTHLERQRGGFGFLGGPGESQLEIDRRLIDNRIIRIKKDLEQVMRTRGLHRQARQRVPYPVVTLVGYTNAGKSTLFNRLTQADVFAEDLLFATLDPTMRQVRLPSGRVIILSDTVGFISDLPTQLVAAFRATLEEVVGADVLVHVRDIAHPETSQQNQDVDKVLQELGIDLSQQKNWVEVLNKVDLLPPDGQPIYRIHTHPIVPISATHDKDFTKLLSVIDDMLAENHETVRIKVELSDGARLAWLYRHGYVMQRRDDAQHAHLMVRLAPADLKRYNAQARG